MSTTTSAFPASLGQSAPLLTGTGGSGPAGYSSAASTGGEQSLDRSDPRRPSSRPPPSNGERHAVKQHLAQALRYASALAEAASARDPEGAVIAGVDLRGSLQQLWRLRHVRSDDWATIVNDLQVVTSGVDFEAFTSDMATAVWKVVENHLRPDADNDDVRAATLLLERAELNPWIAIAMPEDD